MRSCTRTRTHVHAHAHAHHTHSTACAAQSSADGCLSEVVTKECRNRCTEEGRPKYAEDECYYDCIQNREYESHYYTPDQVCTCAFLQM